MQKQTEIDFDPKTKSHEELRDFFKLPDNGKNMTDDMNEKMLESVKLRVKARQINFFAFLNKEFNIMNYKSARCSMHCFDTASRPMTEVNSCLKMCREGIVGCRDFAQNLQDNAKEELEKCKKEAQ